MFGPHAIVVVPPRSGQPRKRCLEPMCRLVCAMKMTALSPLGSLVPRPVMFLTRFTHAPEWTFDNSPPVMCEVQGHRFPNNTLTSATAAFGRSVLVSGRASMRATRSERDAAILGTAHSYGLSNYAI
jgi:hypothetical protein